MKKINIAFAHKQHLMLAQMVGKNFHKIAFDKIISDDYYYGIIGLYIGDKIYKLSNFIEVLDYYGMPEDVAVLKLNSVDDSEIISPIKNRNMDDIAVNKIINKIELVDENQKLYQGNDLKYDNWLTRGIIFHFDDGTELSLEKGIWFSENIYFKQGHDLINNFADLEEFNDNWKPDEDEVNMGYNGIATRKIFTFYF